MKELKKINKRTLPVEIKTEIFEMKQKYGMADLPQRVIELKEKFNFTATTEVVRQAMTMYINKEDIYRTNKLAGSRPRWTTEEVDYCAKMYLALPPRANPDEWQKLLTALNKAFPCEPSRSKKAVFIKMDKVGIKRKTFKVPTNSVTFEYYDTILRPYNMKLLEWEPGVQRWKILCLICKNISVKENFWDMPGKPKGCKYCVDDPNAYAELYLTKVFLESGAHSKLGISKDPSNRIPSFGETLTDTTWPNLINSIGRKIEDQVAEKFGKFKTFPEELIGNGHTECYNPLVHEQIKEYVYQLLLDAKSRRPQNIS